MFYRTMRMFFLKHVDNWLRKNNKFCKDCIYLDNKRGTIGNNLCHYDVYDYVLNRAVGKVKAIKVNDPCSPEKYNKVNNCPHYFYDKHPRMFSDIHNCPLGWELKGYRIE